MILIAGPCVIEDEGLLNEIAQELKQQLAGLTLDFYFKASFDKANRTSIKGFRGPGAEAGVVMLARIREKYGFKILTDIHLPEQAEPVAKVVDAIQIPAFLCRQTDLVLEGARAALKYGRKINIKKGQFLAPWDMRNVVEKVRSLGGGDSLWLTERGSSFGYNALVVDMASFQHMQRFGVPVIYDATHSVQVPGAAPGGESTGGKRENIEVLARAAMAAGADGLFMECHPRPQEAKSDGPNAFYLDKVGAFVRQMVKIRETVNAMPKLLPEAQTRG